MIRYKNYISQVAATVVLAGSFASAAHAASFSADITTSELLITQATNKTCPARGVATGTGTSGQLGDIEIGATDCVTKMNGGAVLQFNNGRMIMAATDGSGSIVAIYQGSFYFTTQQSDGTVLYTMNGGTFSIIGGTGRYTKATGGGTLSGTEIVDLNPAVPAHGQLKASGNMSY